MYVRVRVTPDTKKERVTKLSETEFDIMVREPAQQNRANERVRMLVARECGVSLTAVRIVAGHRSRTKVMSVEM